MGVYVYVGNLSRSMTEEIVRSAFEAAGTAIRSMAILRSPQNGHSRGFGFAEFHTESEAVAATQAMNGVEVEGRPIRVAPVTQRAPRREPGSGFQSYSGLGGWGSSGPRRHGKPKRKPR